MSDYKTNYFGSFLDTMKTPSHGASTAGQSTPRSNAADAVLQTLLQHDGRADIKDLLPHTGFSVDGLIQVIDTLDSFGFVKRDGTVVTLTPAGSQAAAAKAVA